VDETAPGGVFKNVTARSSLCVVAVAVALSASSAYASCIPSTPAQQRARASVIFEGIALEGPTATGIQRFRVSRYIKGRGPRIVRVNTGHIRRADGTGTITSVSLFVKRNDRWRILARGSALKVLQSNACDGSRKLNP
jgi:hypothetical protein